MRREATYLCQEVRDILERPNVDGDRDVVDGDSHFDERSDECREECHLRRVQCQKYI